MDKVFNFPELFHLLSDKIEQAYVWICQYLSSLSSAGATAAVLFLALLVLLLCLVLVWYIKTIVFSIRKEKRIEREYQSKLDNRLNKKWVVEGEIADPEEMKQQKKEELERTEQPYLKPQKTALPLDLDWKNKKTKNRADKIAVPDTFQYQFKPQKLVNLLGLIMDLLQRNVDEPKIAQSIMYKNQHLNSEDDIIQAVTTVKFFIMLCVNGRFKNLDAHKTLPQEDAALFHLANGDCSLALVLTEALMDQKINEIRKYTIGKEQEKAWCEVSNIATIFGTLATFHDLDLAAAAFELAIEMNPKNVTAWGRLGDMYFRKDKQEKAVWAYSNVINIADEGIYTQQTANANKIMASYYNEIGSRVLAENMLKNANKFYNSIGIDAPLNEKEVKIVDLIETRHFDHIEKIIDNLFVSKVFLQQNLF